MYSSIMTALTLYHLDQQRLGMALLLPYKVMKLNSDGSFASDSVRNLSYAAYEKEVVEIVY